MKGYYIKAHVGAEMRQFVTASYNSDTIPLERDSVLMDIIKPHLELRPKESSDDFPPDETIKIEIPHINGKVYCRATNKVYICNTLFRDVLSEDGHSKVRRFLERNFKKSFRCFMDGYTEAQLDNGDDHRLRVRRGAVSYLMNYHIDVSEKLVARLVRDWFRHREKNEKNDTGPYVL